MFLYKFASDLIPINNIAAEIIEINVFPNPASEKIILHMPDDLNNEFSISIINASGQIVFELNDQNNEGEKVIYIQSFPAGMYSVKIVSNNNIGATEKCMKL